MRASAWPPWELYQAYESARDEVEIALADWRAAPLRRRREAFIAYRAAADREDAAALAWLHGSEAYDAERPRAA